MADALELLKTRRSIKPVELVGPGPSKAEIETLLTIASRVPDHGKLVPWRFIIFEDAARLAAGDAIAAAFSAKYPQAKPEHIQAERARLARAPLVIAVVSRAAPHVKIPEWEQVLSAGAAAMSLVLAAHALGYGASWITEWTGPAPRSMRSPPASEAASFRFASLPSAKLRRIYWSESARAGSSRALHFALR
ncbi:MAG: nitroreductase [Alphaproteobacteria bacterium]|nr:MAG: nitroreductase [Alphaproteobacteria bacterium]